MGSRKLEENPNIKHDYRHALTPGVYVPPEEESLDICRCDTCKRLVTEFEIARWGCCPKCGNQRMRGTWETPFESVMLYFWMITKNWRVTGQWKKESLWSKIKKSVSSFT